MNKQIRNTSGALILFSILSIAVYGQETISVSGGNASGTGGRAAYTVGQVAYIQVTGTNGFIIQGVQQPFEISVITAAENTEDITLTCVVYPNPASTYLKLVVSGLNAGKLKYSICNLNGLLLQDKNIDGPSTSISLDGYQAGIYFLRIVRDNREIKTFRIIKK